MKEFIFNAKAQRRKDAKRYCSFSTYFLILRHCFQNFPSDVIGTDGFALGGEVGDDTVTKNRQRYCRNIIAAHVELAVQHGPGFGGHDEIEAGAGPGAPR